MATSFYLAHFPDRLDEIEYIDFHPVKGGGWQYKIPKPDRYLRYTTPFPQR